MGTFNKYWILLGFLSSTGAHAAFIHTSEASAPPPSAYSCSFPLTMAATWTRPELASRPTQISATEWLSYFERRLQELEQQIQLNPRQLSSLSAQMESETLAMAQWFEAVRDQANSDAVLAKYSASVERISDPKFYSTSNSRSPFRPETSKPAEVKIGKVFFNHRALREMETLFLNGDGAQKRFDSWKKLVESKGYFDAHQSADYARFRDHIMNRYTHMHAIQLSARERLIFTVRGKDVSALGFITSHEYEDLDKIATREVVWQ